MTELQRNMELIWDYEDYVSRETANNDPRDYGATLLSRLSVRAGTSDPLKLKNWMSEQKRLYAQRTREQSKPDEEPDNYQSDAAPVPEQDPQKAHMLEQIASLGELVEKRGRTGPVVMHI